MIKNIDYHCAQLERQFPIATQLACFGHLPRKRYTVNYTFQTWNYSFILSGTGFFIHNGKRHTIEAPAMLYQWPGVPMHYGPDTHWNECYVIYPPEAGNALQQHGMHPHDQPFRKLNDTSHILTTIEELHQVCDHDEQPCGDRIDRIAERLVMEAFMAAQQAPKNRNDERLTRIRHLLAQDFTSDHNFQVIAAEHGLSYPHFRRLWRERFKEPPHQFIIRQRLQRACLLLATGSQTIQEIAMEVGITDPLYFSKLFKQHFNVSPRAYRTRYQRPRRETN